MSQPPRDRQDKPGMSRRGFLGAIGATAAIAPGAKAQNALPVYQDSFGNTAPAAGDALSAGVFPPPVYNAAPGPSAVTPGYTQPNILMIVVDQLRAPRWLPAGGQAAVDQLLPNLAFLRNHSFNFPNYFVNATDCTPSRAAMVTGLYSQQTFLFRTQGSAADPSLQTGFPTFGAALAQHANYETCWIGKWHLSDFSPQTNGQGANGPGDYGFNAGSLNLPKDSSLASPFGCANEGTAGYNNTPYGNGTLAPAPTVPTLPAPPTNLLSDGAIANWFVEQFLPNAPASKPWCTTVSFINPHDITAFPYSFGLAGTGNFGKASSNAYGYQPPPTAGYPFSAAAPDDYIPVLNTALYPQNGAKPAGWNVGDDAISQPYGVQTAAGWGKPGLQAYFESYISGSSGAIENVNGWFTFLNYYYWLQSAVDYQIGRVLTSLASSPFASNTIIIFTSDHGEYAGSHNLHTKGGALYDESINVPLYISFPSMRPPFGPAACSRTRSFVCSSVDLFPLLYTLALGNNSWRNNPADPYAYLSGREAILDAIFSTSPVQRRLSPFPNSNGVGYQPYILHTTDELSSANIPGNPSAPQPSHAIAYRTVDTTVNLSVGASNFYGGAKLGIYSYWPCAGNTPDPSKAQQYEFYNYTAGNVGELGNSALVSATQLDVLPGQYLAAFNAASPAELYVQYPQVQAAGTAAKAAFVANVTPKNGC